MIRRLVENQEIDRLQQQLNHRQPRPFTAGQHLHLLHRLFRSAKHESTQQITNLVPNLTLRHIVNRLEYRQVLIHQRCLVLCEISDLHIMPQRQRAVMLNLPHDTLHECRLTLTVLADESHFVSALNRQICVAEHRLLTVCLAYTVHNHRITARPRRRREFQPQCRRILFVHFQQLQLLQHLYAALHLQRL